MKMQQDRNHPMPDHVAAAFETYPLAVRKKLMQVRKLILAKATEMNEVGPLTETLKWSEPAYVTEAKKTGSTIRLGWPKSHPDRAAVYFNCNTTLISTFRDLFPGEFEYSGNRAIMLPLDKSFDEAALVLCIGMALTYHHARR